MTLSRRTFLKSMGLLGAGAAAATSKLSPALAKTLEQNNIPALPAHWQGQPLGRVTSKWQYARAEPNTDSEIVFQHNRDDILRVRRSLRARRSLTSSV